MGKFYDNNDNDNVYLIILQNISREVCRSIKLGKYASFSRIVPVLKGEQYLTVFSISFSVGFSDIHLYNIIIIPTLQKICKLV